MEIPGEKIHSKVIFYEGYVFHRNKYCVKQKRVDCKDAGQKIEGGKLIKKGLLY
jgi:hypothetical protein